MNVKNSQDSINFNATEKCYSLTKISRPWPYHTPFSFDHSYPSQISTCLVSIILCFFLVCSYLFLRYPILDFYHAPTPLHAVCRSQSRYAGHFLWSPAIIFCLLLYFTSRLVTPERAFQGILGPWIALFMTHFLPDMFSSFVFPVGLFCVFHFLVYLSWRLSGCDSQQ